MERKEWLVVLFDLIKHYEPYLKPISNFQNSVGASMHTVRMGIRDDAICFVYWDISLNSHSIALILWINFPSRHGEVWPLFVEIKSVYGPQFSESIIFHLHFHLFFLPTERSLLKWSLSLEEEWDKFKSMKDKKKLL